MSKTSERLRKLTQDIIAMDGDMLLPSDTIDPEEAADLLDEAEKAPAELLSLHIAHHNMPTHAAARATPARIRGEHS
jgi:hypothetical protein